MVLTDSSFFGPNWLVVVQLGFGTKPNQSQSQLEPLPNNRPDLRTSLRLSENPKVLCNHPFLITMGLGI